jgi:hypothetical protein
MADARDSADLRGGAGKASNGGIAKVAEKTGRSRENGQECPSHKI